MCVTCFLSFWDIISSSFFNDMADKMKNTPCTWWWPCINSSCASPLVTCATKCTESLFCVWVCARMCKSWLTGCVCVSPSARDADEREKWIHALEGTILRHTLQLRVWNNTFLSISACVSVCVSERILLKETWNQMLKPKMGKRVVIQTLFLFNCNIRVYVSNYFMLLLVLCFC